MTAYRDIKNFIKYLEYKFKHRNIDISYGARFEQSSCQGEDCSIGRNSTVTNSVINDKVNIATSAKIIKSLIESYSYIYSNCSISNSELGRFGYISKNTLVSMANIGSFCSIGPYSIIGYGNHPTNLLSTSPVFYSSRKQCGFSFSDSNQFDEYHHIDIGNDVWIGARSFIRDGVRIENGAIIGAGAVVVKDVPAYAIVGGVPARLIRYRFHSDIIQKLQEIQWWNWSLNELKEALIYFNQSDISKFIEYVEHDKS